MYFKDSYSNYEVATVLNQRTPEICVATLKSIIGKSCYKTLLTLPDLQATVDQILNALEKYFLPQSNVIYEWYQFNSTQGGAESVNDYIQWLRKLSKSCEFGALSDEMIRDRLVLGIADSNARGRLLRETLQNANVWVARLRYDKWNS